MNTFGLQKNSSKYGAMGNDFTKSLSGMPGSHMLTGQSFREGKNFLMNRLDTELRAAKSAYDRQEIQKKIDWANKTRPWEREVKHGGNRAYNADKYYDGISEQYNAYSGRQDMYKRNAALKANKAGMATGPNRYDKRPIRDINNEMALQRMKSGMMNRFGGGFK